MAMDPTGNGRQITPQWIWTDPGLALAVEQRPSLAPARRWESVFSSLVFPKDSISCDAPTSGSETCGDRTLPSPPISPAHGASLATTAMIHRLAFGLRLNALCGGTSGPWEALDGEENVFTSTVAV